MNSKDILKKIKEDNIKFISFQFNGSSKLCGDTQDKSTIVACTPGCVHSC